MSIHDETLGGGKGIADICNKVLFSDGRANDFLPYQKQNSVSK
jgi:hypothetical protein